MPNPLTPLEKVINETLLELSIISEKQRLDSVDRDIIILCIKSAFQIGRIEGMTEMASIFSHKLDPTPEDRKEPEPEPMPEPAPPEPQGKTNYVVTSDEVTERFRRL